MIGFGLSLMGGVLAQNDQGGAETVYYPSRAAYCTRMDGIETNLYRENIRRAWSDETSWVHATSLLASLPSGTVLGAGVINVNLGGGNYVAGQYIQKNYPLPYYVLSLFTWNPNKIEVPLPSTQPPSVEFEFTFHGGRYNWQLPAFVSRSGIVAAGDIGDDSTQRYVSVYNNVRTFWGLSYQSEKGNTRVIYAPMTDGQGHSAIWSVFSQTLVEL